MTSTMQAGDKLAGEGAHEPRICLSQLNALIDAEHYFTAADAVRAMGCTPTDGEGVLTICVLTLRNGYTIIGKSAPASVGNFDREKGRIFARDDALRQVWPLEGYVLRNQLAGITGEDHG